MGLRMSDWFQFLRAAMKTGMSLLLPRTIPEPLQTLELSSMSFPESCRGRPETTRVHLRSQTPWPAVRHHCHCRHHSIGFIAMSNIGMIMSGRTQLWEQLVLSDMLFGSFWIFLRFKPSSLNMLEDCLTLVDTMHLYWSHCSFLRLKALATWTTWTIWQLAFKAARDVVALAIRSSIAYTWDPVSRHKEIEICSTFSRSPWEAHDFFFPLEAERIWKRNHWWLIGSGHLDLPEVSTSRCSCFFWCFLVCDKIRCCNALQRLPPTAHPRRHTSCFSQRVDPLAVPWMFHQVKNTTRPATGVQPLLSFESEFAGGIKEWSTHVDTETGTCVTSFLTLVIFVFLSRQQNGRSYPSYACIGWTVERACVYLIFLGLHVWHLCDICVILVPEPPSPVLFQMIALFDYVWSIEHDPRGRYHLSKQRMPFNICSPLSVAFAANIWFVRCIMLHPWLLLLRPLSQTHCCIPWHFSSSLDLSLQMEGHAFTVQLLWLLSITIFLFFFLLLILLLLLLISIIIIVITIVIIYIYKYTVYVSPNMGCAT